MRTVSLRLVDLQKSTIPIGFMGENLHTQVRIDCKKLFDEYPTSVPALSVVPKGGTGYPAVTTRDGDLVIWDVTDSDLVNEGVGEIQLTFTVNSVVAKSYIGKIRVDRSLSASGTAPDPVEDWLVEANTALNAIPQTIDDALAAAKASGEFDGADGFSPVVEVSDITGGHQVSITDATGTETFDVMDGEDGQPGADGHSPVVTASKSDGVTTVSVDGQAIATINDGEDGQDGSPGADGYSPSASVSKSGHTATITITDKNGTTTAQISDGESVDPTTIIDDTAGSGDTNKVWSANKSSELLSAISDKQDAPETAGTAGQVLSLDNNLDPVWTTPQSGGGTVTDVQINGTSILSQGVANIPIASASAFGVVKPSASSFYVNPNTGVMQIQVGTEAQYKSGANSSVPLAASQQHTSVFFGLSKVAGEDLKSDTVTVGTYPEKSLSAISQMLNAPVSVSGTTPSITAKAGVRYICGECSTLTITVPTSGCIDVVFTSGSTATVLTVTPTKTGVTAIKWANGFDPSSLEANTRYEVLIDDGEWGMVASWT